MMKNGREYDDLWKLPRYKRGGAEYLRLSSKVTFKYFSARQEWEERTATVVGRMYHAGWYIADDDSGNRWAVYLGDEEAGQWYGKQ